MEIWDQFQSLSNSLFNKAPLKILFAFKSIAFFYVIKTRIFSNNDQISKTNFIYFQRMNSKYRGLSHEIVSPLLLFATSESVYYSMSYLHFKFLPKGVRSKIIIMFILII